MNLLKWWLNRKPFVPSILTKVDPIVVDPLLEGATEASIQRAEKAALKTRNTTASVVTLHQEVLRLIEGNRA